MIVIIYQGEVDFDDYYFDSETLFYLSERERGKKTLSNVQFEHKRYVWWLFFLGLGKRNIQGVKIQSHLMFNYAR